MLASLHAEYGMVFYLQESPGNEESRLGMAHGRLEGRDKEEHPTGEGGGPAAPHHEDNAAGRADAGRRLAGSFQHM